MSESGATERARDGETYVDLVREERHVDLDRTEIEVEEGVSARSRLVEERETMGLTNETGLVARGTL